MSKRLLLADDSITIQKVVQITFAHEDYDLTVTDNGDAALVKAREIAPQLVLADVYMPGKNGYELCAAIKQDPALRQVPVLLLAGSFEPFDEAKARAVGADAWIEKPFESQALIDKVATLLNAVPAAPAAPPVAVPEAIAPPADPFADIAFEEPAAAAMPPAAFATPADDWSDLNLAAEPVTSVPPVDFAFEKPAAAPPAFEFDSNAFAAPITPPATAVEPPPIDFGAFGEPEDVMALGDDDILGAEDLEPADEMSTLTPWSRTDFAVGDAFEEFAAEELAAPVSVAPQEAVASATVFAVEPAPLQPPPPVTPSAAPPVAEVEPVAAPANVAVEQRVATLSEAEIEQIVERAVGKVIEKLAGSVLEKVAWEVVPDLAEALIKEEIRKIKDAAA